MVYHDEAMYVASDSLGTSFAYDNPSHALGDASHSVRKILPIAENCCAAFTGFAGHGVESPSGKTLLSLNVPKSLERLCAMELTNSASVNQKIESVVTKLDSEYRAFFRNGLQITGTLYDHEPTRLQFFGFDPEKRCFFVKSSLLDGTNSARIEAVKEFRGMNNPEFISLQGEARFLLALLGGAKPDLLKLISDDFAETLTELDSTNSVSDARTTNLLLEMFKLHKDNAAHLGYDKGQIAAPYRIFKLTKEKIVEITPVSQIAQSKASHETVAQHDSADDKAIASVMERLEKSFLSDDYSYAFDVMYAPIVEKMGGRENLAAMVKSIAAQIKEQQIVVLSWKAGKPYQYIRAESRTYAIIPYEAVMKIAGKKLRQESYQLGVKTADSQWQFVNGDNLSPDTYRDFFPDFPKNFELPKVERSYE